MPGRGFTSPADFNAQLAEWLVRANQRQHRRLGRCPIERWEAHKAGMLELPPVAPVTGWRLTTRLPRDHFGRWVEIVADLDQVVVTLHGNEAAWHERC